MYKHKTESEESVDETNLYYLLTDKIFLLSK